MAYEIPQQLEYKEKIMFGLTAKQLGYAFLFALFMAIIFFKSSINFYLKIFICINLSALAVGFMFLNLGYYLKAWSVWIRNRKIEKPDKLAKFLPVQEIKDNIIFTKDKRKIAILKVEPLNFSIKPEGAKEAITAQFQKFLNGLDFPVQILMNTESLDLKDYFTELEKRVQKQGRFQELFVKYKEHLESVALQHNVLNRSFYLAIPELGDLSIQLSICQTKLDAIGLKSSRVGDEKLKELVNKFFEIQEKTKLPGKIENFPSYIKIGNTYNRIIYAHGYPRSVETGFLDRIVSSLGNFDLSFHIDPYDIEMTMVLLNKELQKQRADLYSARNKGILNPSLEIQSEDTEGVLRNLQKGKEKLFNISLYVNCRAQSKEELDKLTRRIYAELNSLLIIPKQPLFRMLQGLHACSPLATNPLKITRKITTEPLSAFFPFTSSFLQADKTGVWLGLNKNKIPIIKDIFALSNPNGICLASSGSGKSYMSKLLIARYLLTGTKVMVIDPQGEYRGLIQRFNGQRIDLSRNSKTMINPLDLMGHDYSEKRLALMDLMPIMLGELTEPQKAFIDKALTEAYKKKGISDEPDTWNNTPPILQDVAEVLEIMEKRAIVLEKSTIRSLINRLSLYTEGVFSFMNRHTNINFDNQFVCFDIGSLPKQVKPVIMFLVLDYVYMKMKENLERKLLVIDEAWSLLGRTEDASYIFEIVKTCRKFNLALFLINQEVEGMLESQAGKSVLANSAYTLLMRQKPAVIKAIQETFYLSNSERIFLLTANIGEGILLIDDEHSEIKIVASPEEHNLITTKPDELLEQADSSIKQFLSNKVSKLSEGAKKPTVDITVDEHKRFYKHKDVTLPELKYLVKKGYKLGKHLNILGKRELYVLKPRRGESEGHFFLTYDIANYLRKFTDKVELFETTKPDIIFEINNAKYAVEVETGKIYTKDKKKLQAKVDTLNKEYGQNWFFVVTDKNFYPEYSKFGQTYTKLSIAQAIVQRCKQ
jgi:type IV secretory pathway VirB4 component